ncbi:Maltose O-acetyltransferase [Stieleria neptunia]|uniref:Maltose O-acetyltransferase n=1 Tax=Stieleria neptunia TaxID=2527979 RepID=A0A518HR29_9BACT|nr:acyltransferase [Stieleria neptunia]QDV43251.1 Maltose O-acetyltransferase [Stieleria neptunia]
MPPEPVLRRLIKFALNTTAAVLVAPSVLVCYLETKRGPGYERFFHGWGQFYAVMPGLFGMCLRRAFYRGTLTDCSIDCQIAFGVLFNHREAIIGSEVYIGPYALMGRVKLGRGSLIGSRSSILSTGEHHVMDANGRWTTPDNLAFEITEIGEYCWIGEAAIVMAGVGDGAMISAGAVTATKIPDHVMVAGNPARFVKRLIEDELTEPAEGGKSLGAVSG